VTCRHPLIQKMLKHWKQQDAHNNGDRKDGSRGPLPRHYKHKIHELFDPQKPGNPTVNHTVECGLRSFLRAAVGQAFGTVAAYFGAGDGDLHAEVFFDLRF
jgi:hypothetical protein